MILDILVLIVLLISAGIAFMRGFIREALTIAGVGGGLLAAYFLGPAFVVPINKWLGVEEGVEAERLFGVLPYDILGTALAYGSVFIVVVILLSIASHFLAEGAKAMGLGAVDRTLGFMFGIVRGIIVLGLLYLPVHLFIDQDTKDGWFEGSKSHIYIEKTSAFFASFFSEEAREQSEEVLQKAGDAVQTREKLKQIDLLKDNENLEEQLKKLEDSTAPQEMDGYDEDFRDSMDSLIEQNTEQYNTNE